MIRSLLRNYSLQKKASAIPRERLSIFFTLMRLDFKVAFLDKKNRECSERFFRYRIWGYNYWVLRYLFKEIFLAKEYFFDTDKEAPVIVDCGANIGMSILYFKKQYARARIIAFEANPDSFRLLQKNVGSNRLSDVMLHNLLLSDHEGEASFFISDDRGSLLASTMKERGGERELQCHSEKLSQFVKDLDKIDLIKMDVEGSELMIVNDLVACNLLRRADQYIIEYHHHLTHDHSSFSRFLGIFEAQGFGYNIKAAFNHLRGFQDILIHFYQEERDSA